ncbi:hypothetical protein M1384_01440 [Candidatus Parvarchaeota archaeon]|jgi:hypothetical protein|nr:hypothetical protein [Candidatus Parvarchaeota archaeon]
MKGLCMNFSVWPPKTLEDILIKNSEEEIDKDIIPLVKAINLFGVPTYSSCAGHVNGTGLPYPWIGVLKKQYNLRDYSHSIKNLYTKQKEYLQFYLKESLERFYVVLDRFNETNNENMWVLEELTYSHLRPRRPCKDEIELDTERKKSVILANLLFNEFRGKYCFYAEH